MEGAHSQIIVDVLCFRSTQANSTQSRPDRGPLVVGDSGALGARWGAEWRCVEFEVGRGAEGLRVCGDFECHGLVSTVRGRMQFGCDCP